VACAAARRRRFRILLGASLAFHVLAVSALAFVPEPAPPPLARVISIDLLSLPAPAPSKPAPAPAKPAPAPPKKIVLPKKAPALRAKPKKVKPAMSRPRPKELEYDEALANLRSEMGEPEPPTPPAEAEVVASEGGEAESAAAGEGGAPVSAEVKAWEAAVKRHVRSGYVTPPEFLDRTLVTCLQVVLTVEGDVLGEPDVVIGSGDPFWDDNAIRTVMSASPLPPPPEPGTWPFCFPSEAR
jgi:outer membrane biosynthesis protein TonB